MTNEDLAAAFDRELWNVAVNDAWLHGVPEAMAETWVYMDQLEGEHDVDRGRGKLILRHLPTEALYSVPFFCSTWEGDLYDDRFKGEPVTIHRVEPYTKVIEYTDYRAIA